MTDITAILLDKQPGQRYWNPSGQRFYRLSRPITNIPIKAWTLQKLIDDLRIQYPTLQIPAGQNSWDTFCISDAHTHYERLVFLATYHNQRWERLPGPHIDGQLTMMIHGGDSGDMKPDKVYLRRLASANGYYFAGIMAE